jgi:predicted alpha/beta-hydrolase family hydrolase
MFAQYVHISNGRTNRGVVVLTTGATTGRESNGMVGVCSQLSVLALLELGFISEDHEYNGYERDIIPDENDA